MGIPKFFNYIKQTYCSDRINQCIFESINFSKVREQKEYDYLFLDYQSFIYNAYAVFSSEINYFIRLIYFFNYSAKHGENTFIYKNYLITNSIIQKYTKFFERVFGKGKGSGHFILPKKIHRPDEQIREIISKTNSILSRNFKDEANILEFLSDFVVNHTKNLADHHIIHPDKYARTHIFFDGVLDVQ